MPIAITRPVGPRIGECQLTHQQRSPIDYDRACEQHRAYEQCLEGLGCTIERLAPEPNLPDSVFVEDTAVVLDEIAIITRPGAESRRPETASVAPALARHRNLVFIEEPGTIDGGDVLVFGRSIYVGLSSRTNEPGLEQLQELTRAHGYAVAPVPVSDCLHLKSAVTQIGPDDLLANPALVDVSMFGSATCVFVDPVETAGANALMIGKEIIYPAAFPRTAERLIESGYSLHLLDMSELAKAEGAVTCCSLLLRTPR